MMGQCGPRILSFKSLFSPFRSWDDASSIHRDRQAELQLVWEEIGDNKSKKLEQLQQSVSAAIQNIYERALEENTRRKADLEDMVAKSETRLKELLGPNAFEVMASQHLPLQTRLNINMTHLKAMESVGIIDYGWVGGLLVLVKLRHRIAAFREMLKLPPCDSADLDEMLARTTEDLYGLCPRTMNLVPSITVSKSTQKPIFQRMHQFYHTLCAIESIWVHSLVNKDAQKGPNVPHFFESPLRQCFEKDSSLRWNTKCSSSKIRSKTMENGHATLCDEALAMDQLSKCL